MGALAWCLVGVVWFFLTRGFHPDITTGACATAALIGTYAFASYVDQLVMRRGLSGAAYAVGLVSLVLTAGGIALLGARLVYIRGGYTPGPWLYHFGIDTVGAAVHIVGAAWAVALWKRFI